MNRSGIERVIIAVMALAPTWVASSFAQAPASVAAPNASWTIPSNGEIRELLAERMLNNGVGTVVGVIEPAGRRVIACGKSGASDNRALDGDTVFQIGSVTKIFTTLLLADMVQRGEVKLDDPASKFLPAGVRMPERGKPNPDETRAGAQSPSRPITLKDLAHHRSGLPSMPTNFPLHGVPNPVEAYTVEQLYEFLSSYTLEREPGEKWAYSNLGVSLLGRLLANRAGMDYEALLNERVLKPLGMRSTSITLTPEQSARLAPGHDRYLRPVYSWEMRTLPASGSLRSTANDLLILLAAHLGYSDTSLQSAAMYQRTVRDTPDGMALGWAVRKIGNDEIFLHDGGKAGYRSAVAFNPNSRTGVVVLSNARTDDRPAAIALHLLIGRALAPAPPPPPGRNPIALDRKVLDSYAGRYRLSAGQTVEVLRKDEHLLVDIDRDGGAEFFAVGARDFFLNTDKGDITFQVDAAGRVTELWLYAEGRESGKHQVAPRIGAGSQPEPTPRADFRIL